MLLVELMLHDQSSTISASAAAPGGAGAATAAASSGDPLPVGAVSLVPAAEGHADLSSSSGTEFVAFAGSAVHPAPAEVAVELGKVRAALLKCQESISNCETKIGSIERQTSALNLRLEAVDISDVERDELESRLAKLDSKETLVLQLQSKLQDEKVLLREEEIMFLRQRDAPVAQSGASANRIRGKDAAATHAAGSSKPSTKIPRVLNF